MTAIEELESDARSAMEWLYQIASVVRYRGVDVAWREWIAEAGMMTDQEAREIVSAEIANSTPSDFAQFKAARKVLEEAAAQAVALFEAREGRLPHVREIRHLPGAPPVRDIDSRLTILSMALVRSLEFRE
jgi:hypothetical protein